MHPLLFNTIYLYFVMWACAAITGVVMGARVAAQARLPIIRSDSGTRASARTR